MTSFKTPTQQQIDTAVQRMRSPEFAAYFFSRLENPLWVAPLHEKGLFASPPPPILVEGGRVSFSHWPASKYLARVAKHVPSEVASIFEDLQTDNVFVIGDMLDAALAMPPQVATTLVPAVGRSARAGTLWLHFKDASDFCICLANGGEVSSALTLAEALFAPQFERGQEEPSRRDEYWYKEGLKRVSPVLVRQRPNEFLLKLCDWLHASIDAKNHVNLNSGADYSWSWRPAIEDHEQNRDYDFAGAMVGFVRQGLEEAIHDGSLPFEEVLEIIDRHTYLVFKRIRIHLINEFAEQCPDLARRYMMDHGLFDDLYYKHEYAMLVGRHLDLLTDEERNTWFGWVDAGPDMSHFNKLIKERLGNDATDEERQDRKRYWQFEKLHCVRKHLDGERRRFYEGMLAQHGEPELADLNSRISTGWGHHSPLNVDDLTKLTFEEAIKRVASWVPGERQFIGHDIEGLASTFGQYVATNPDAFSAQAHSLISAPAIYVSAFIHQMADAVKAGRETDVHSVLKLCHWVLERPVDKRTTGEQGHDVLVDKDWQWTRDEISQFVQNTCKAMVTDAPKYPLDVLQEPIWQVVSALYRDRSQSYIVHDKSQDDPRTRDYLDLGINSPRGKAVEAALEYARWVANHIKKTTGKHEVVPGGFDSMPEVREMLKWQISPENRSFEAMALIGSRMSLIYWIDKNWLSENTDRLFHLEGIEESPRAAEGWAAWNAFLVWVRPHIEFYRQFKKQFAYAVTQSEDVDLAEKTRGEPMNHLGEHLMILYGRGQLEIEDDEGLFRRFLTRSNPVIRRHAIGFIGRSIEGDERIPEEVIDRFKVLWETYWDGVGKKDAEEDPHAWLFGTWFSVGRFPEEWALDQLDEYVKVTPTPEPDHAIMEQLAKVAPVNLQKAVNILDRMVHGDREGWRVHGWLDSARQVLEMAMKASGSPQAQAEKTINYLGRRGHTGFGDLLPPNPLAGNA